MNQAKPELSVVILCYKSGDFARIFYKKTAEALKKLKINYQIVLVGNYWEKSGDITPKVIREIKKNNKNVKSVVRIKHASHHNMGWDMKSGLAASEGDVIAVIDGDGQFKPGDIPKLYRKLKKGDFDLCKTERVSRRDGSYRKFISRVYNLLMQLFFPGIANDINGKPKVFKRHVYNKLNLVSDDWFIDAEIMIKARKHKLKVGQVKTDFRKNPSRKSFITFKENFEFLKNIIRWRLAEWGI